MIRAKLAYAAMALVLASSGLAPPRPAQAETAASCDRACLDGLVDAYLAALVARDPAQAPVAADVKFTENGQRLQLGDGLWGTIDGLEGYKLYVADPAAGQVGFFGTIKESGRDQILGLRLKVVDRRITEVESLVVRPKTGSVFGAPQDLKDKPIFHAVVPPAERRPRAEMIRIANSYFEGLEKATAALTPFDANCQRVENGIATASNPASPNPMFRMSCGAQFATRFSQFITHIRDRRFPIVDEEHGLVFALVFFDHAGRMKTQTLADGTVSPVPADMQVPFTFQIGELFKIQDGKIMRVEALVIPAPYHMASGW